MHLATTLYFKTVARLYQGGGKSVTRVYHNLATILYYETLTKVHFENIAIKCSRTQVIKSVTGFKHFTKNVSAICTALSVSYGLLKFLIREEFSGLETDFKAADLVEILLVVSHPVSAWSAGRHHTSSSPRAAQTLCRGNIDLFSPELRMSHSSWRPRFLQLAVKWYNRQTKTSYHLVTASKM